jgi:large subunit ribosomal protein L25
MKKTDQKADKKFLLPANIRKELGKKIKKLRKAGFIPANLFGRNFKSQAISISFKDFIKIYRAVKETGVVYLELEKEEIPVLISHIQRDPVSNQILHVDFRKIDLAQNIEVEVPIKIIGSSPAVIEKGGVLLTHLNSILVSALPNNLPKEIEIDISTLKEIGDEIKVKDLKKSLAFKIKTAPEKTIVAVIAHKKEAAPEAAPPESISPPQPETPSQETKEEKSTSSDKSDKKE